MNFSLTYWRTWKKSFLDSFLANHNRFLNHKPAVLPRQSPNVIHQESWQQALVVSIPQKARVRIELAPEKIILLGSLKSLYEFKISGPHIVLTQICNASRINALMLR